MLNRVGQEISKTFLPYDQEARSQATLTGVPPRALLNITLGHVKFRSNNTGQLLQGSIFAARRLLTPLPAIHEPGELIIYTLSAEVQLTLTYGVTASRPKFNRLLRGQTQTHHEDSIEINDGSSSYTQTRTDKQIAERLGERVIRLGALFGIIEDSQEPDTWPVVTADARVSGLESEELRQEINTTAQGGMSLHDFSPQDPPGGPAWEYPF